MCPQKSSGEFPFAARLKLKGKRTDQKSALARRPAYSCRGQLILRVSLSFDIQHDQAFQPFFSNHCPRSLNATATMSAADPATTEALAKILSELNDLKLRNAQLESKVGLARYDRAWTEPISH